MNKHIVLCNRIALISLFCIFLSFSASSQSWIQSGVLGHPDAQKDDMYGYGMSQYGDILVVGSPDQEYDLLGGNRIEKAGAVYVYHKDSDGSWELSEKLIAPERVVDAQFGRAVCVYGDYLFVNSYETVNSSHHAGKIYVFLRLAHGKYYYVQTLVSQDPQNIENFGLVMAANDNYLFCGTRGDSDDENGTNTMYYGGSVTIFKLSSTDSWDFNRKIVPADRVPNMNFGNAVAVTSGGVLIGARNYTMTTGDEALAVGKVYYYEYDQHGLPPSWKLESVIMNPNPDVSDRFGSSVACDGSTAVIGCMGDDYDADEQNLISGAGAIYVYKQQVFTDNWMKQKKLVAEHRSEGSLFGNSVSISGDLLATGNWMEEGDENGENLIPSAGAVWLYSKKTGDWTFNQRLVLANRQVVDGFGFKVSIHEGALVASATRSNIFGINRGAVFSYDYQPATGIKSDKLQSQVNVFPNPVSDRLFVSLGRSVTSVNISIKTMTGSEVYKMNTSDDQLSIDLSSYPAGIYFIKVDTSQGTITKKIIHK